MRKYIAISLRNPNQDTSPQEREKILGEINGEFQHGQEIEIPGYPGKWKIIKADAYIEKGNELPLLFVFDMTKEGLFTIVHHEPISQRPLTRHQICQVCHKYSMYCICNKSIFKN